MATRTAAQSAAVEPEIVGNQTATPIQRTAHVSRASPQRSQPARRLQRTATSGRGLVGVLIRGLTIEVTHLTLYSLPTKFQPLVLLCASFSTQPAFTRNGDASF
jgi:hypothetical protein